MVAIGRRSLSCVLAFSAPIISALLTAKAASADPEHNPLVETTCNYDQLNAALQVEAPDLASALAQRPAAQEKVHEFLALPVDQRGQRITDVLNRNPQWRDTIEQKRNTPEGQQKLAMIARVADSCHNY